MGAWQADAPSPPDYAAATREGILTDIETLPLRKLIENAAKSGGKVEYKDPSTGEMKTADFTGIGDVDISKQMLAAGIESADALAKAQLDLSKKYSADTIAQRRAELEASDPTGFALREQEGKSIMADLLAGKSLDPGMQADVVNAERGAQAARGNIMGNSSAAAEAMTVGDAGFRLWQQKLANASAFLSGTTPTAQFSALGGAQQGVVGFNPQAVQTGTNINPNAGSQGWQAGMQSWQANFAKNQFEFQNSPWTKLFDTFNSMLVGAAGSAGGMAMG